MVFDRDAALGYLEGKKELMAEMAEIFLSTWEDLLLSLEVAIRDRKGEEAMGMTQSLKGMAASLGGHRTTWAASELESTLREECWEEAPRILLRLRPQAIRLARALSHHRRSAA
jgi:HPt (histidine-containing phosphotransfer) domain-containing protein